MKVWISPSTGLLPLGGGPLDIGPLLLSGPQVLSLWSFSLAGRKQIMVGNVCCFQKLRLKLFFAGSVPTVGQSLSRYSHIMLRCLLPLSLACSVIPLPETLYLGNSGTPFFAPIAPLVLFVSSGFVCLLWGVLIALLAIVGKASLMLHGRLVQFVVVKSLDLPICYFFRRREKAGVPRSTLLSLAVICLAIFLFVPWQVAYLGCWLLHLHTCASSMKLLEGIPQRRDTDAVPLVLHSATSEDSDILPDGPRTPLDRPTSNLIIKQDNLNHNLYMLLLMTWLLPLTAPVLAVWVRTLLTAGYTTPFDGDHNFLAVLPFLIFADYASWTPHKLFLNARYRCLHFLYNTGSNCSLSSFENRVPLRWMFVIVAAIAFIFGSRRPYLVLDSARIAMWILIASRIGRRYWGGSP